MSTRELRENGNKRGTNRLGVLLAAFLPAPIPRLVSKRTQSLPVTTGNSIVLYSSSFSTICRGEH